MESNESNHYNPCQKDWKKLVWCALAVLLLLIYCTVSSTQERISEYQKSWKENVGKYEHLSYSKTQTDSITGSQCWTYPASYQATDAFYPITLSAILSIVVIIVLCTIALKLIDLYKTRSEKETEILSYLYKDEQQRLIIKRNESPKEIKPEPKTLSETERFMKTLEERIDNQLSEEKGKLTKECLKEVESILNKTKFHTSENSTN